MQKLGSDDFDFDIIMTDDADQMTPSQSAASLQSQSRSYEPTHDVPEIPTVINNLGDLCQTCQLLDVADALEEPADPRQDDLRDRLLGTTMFSGADRSTPCPLCCLLRSVRVSRSKDDPGDTFSIYQTFYQRISLEVPTDAFFPRPVFSDIRLRPDKCIVVIPSNAQLDTMIKHAAGDEVHHDSLGYTASDIKCIMSKTEADDRQGKQDSVRGMKTTRHCVPRTIDAQQIDWEIVRGWLTDLPASNNANCDEVDGPPVVPVQRQNSEQLSSLENSIFIDCSNSRITQWFPGIQFLALSYVWGDDQRTRTQASWRPKIGQLLPDGLPLLINDAIAVTKAVGYQFLWVDKYCIDQADHVHKLSQIDVMHLIYSTAIATIVAAAGEDEDYGLPGVSSRPRLSATQSLETRSGTLLSVVSRPEHHISRSRWATRGWTYQEGVLSRRRIVFTDAQLYFECQGWGSGQIEAVDTFTEPSRGAIETHRLGYFASGCMDLAVNNRSVSEDPSNVVWRHIQTYSRRTLRFEEDRLKAFQGILAYYGKHLYGLPMSPNPGARIGHRLCLFWFHGSSTEPMRRPGFPSFSWSGWTGGCMRHETHKATQLRCHVENLAPSFSPSGNCSTSPEGTLQLRAYAEELTCVCKAGGYTPENGDDLNIWRSPMVRLYFGGETGRLRSDCILVLQVPGLSEEIRTSQTVGLRCVWVESGWDGTEILFGILAKRVGDFFERIGCLAIDVSREPRLECVMEYPHDLRSTTPWEACRPRSVVTTLV